MLLFDVYGNVSPLSPTDSLEWLPTASEVEVAARQFLREDPNPLRGRHDRLVVSPTDLLAALP